MKIGSASILAGSLTVEVELESMVHRWSCEAPGLTADRAADALLVASLLPAMRAGETLTATDPVSPRLLASVSQIEDIFLSWAERIAGYGVYQRVSVEVPPRTSPPLPGPRGSACFFTAGVDSFYTVLRHRDEIDALVYVRGFDVALDEAELDVRVLDGVRSAADELGLPLVVVRTDLRAFSDRYSNWDHYHGAALATVAHLLAARFAKFYVPATQTYAFLAPLGTHPLLDPRWSTEDVALIHDGCEASRLDKLDLIASEPAARQFLRVCWENRGGAYNCGRCEKCLRTMVAMDALGLLGSFDRFPHRIATHDITRVRLPDIPHTWEASLAMLEATGRDPAVARALRRRLYGPTTRALHRAVYYARRLRALARG
jgi:hypothetical protein